MNCKLTECRPVSENKATVLLLIPIKRRKCKKRIKLDTAIIIDQQMNRRFLNRFEGN